MAPTNDASAPVVWSVEEGQGGRPMRPESAEGREKRVSRGDHFFGKGDELRRRRDGGEVVDHCGAEEGCRIECSMESWE